MASKDRERFFVESFLRSVGWRYTRIDNSERPDFVVQRPDGPLGIEVTEVFGDEADGGSPRKAIESNRSRLLVQLADDYYGQPNAVPILVKLYLRGPVSPLLRPRLLERLNLTVGSLEPWASIDAFGSDPALGQAALWITRLPEEAGRYARWICMDNFIGWRRRVDHSCLLARVGQKAEKLADYRARSGKVILLIVSDESQDSGMVDYDTSGIDGEEVAAHGFHEVYLHRFSSPCPTHKLA
jgi:hypothetical protein